MLGFIEATTFPVHVDEGVHGRNEERGHDTCSAGVGVRRHTSEKVAEASASFEEADEGEKVVGRDSIGVLCHGSMHNTVLERRRRRR
jgi:hypothetical protein